MLKSKAQTFWSVCVGIAVKLIPFSLNFLAAYYVPTSHFSAYAYVRAQFGLSEALTGNFYNNKIIQSSSNDSKINDTNAYISLALVLNIIISSTLLFSEKNIGIITAGYVVSIFLIFQNLYVIFKTIEKRNQIALITIVKSLIILTILILIIKPGTALSLLLISAFSTSLPIINYVRNIISSFRLRIDYRVLKSNLFIYVFIFSVFNLIFRILIDKNSSDYPIFEFNNMLILSILFLFNSYINVVIVERDKSISFMKQYGRKIFVLVGLSFPLTLVAFFVLQFITKFSGLEYYYSNTALGILHWMLVPILITKNFMTRYFFETHYRVSLFISLIGSLILLLGLINGLQPISCFVGANLLQLFVLFKRLI